MNGYFKVQQLENNLNSQVLLPSYPKSTILRSKDINTFRRDLISTENTDLISGANEFENIKEIPLKKHPQSLYLSHMQSNNNNFQYNKKFNSNLNLNKIPNISTLINSLQNNNLNKKYSPELFYTEENKIGKTHSNFSSFSENKYHFMNDIPISHLIVFNDNSIPKTQKNINPVKTLILSQKENLNNSMNDIYSKFDSKSYSYIPQKNIQKTERDNRYENNKITSSYNYKTVSGNNFQKPIQIATVTPISYDQNPYPYPTSNIKENNIITYYKKNSGFPIKNSPITIKKSQNYLNNYSINNLNNINNFENQRLTVDTKINNINNFFEYGDDIQQKINQSQNNYSFNLNENFKDKKKEPEIATVTPIFSLNTKPLSSYLNNFKSSKNITGNNNTINQTIIHNPINIIENDNKQIVTNNYSQNKHTINKGILQVNNYITENNNINIDDKTKKIKSIQNKGHNPSQRHIISQSINNNKNQKIPKNIQINNKTFINQQKNINISSSNIDSNNLNTNPPLIESQKITSNFRTGTNTILTNYNLNSQSQNHYQKSNLNESKIQKENENKENKNKPKIKKAKTPKKTFEKNKNKEKLLNKKGIQVKYSDFDGSGYIKNYSGVTRPGKDIEGMIKINQDALVCLTNINKIKDFNIFGVLDGHGPEGHFVAEYISNYIPSQIINHPKIKNLSDTEEIYKKFKENNCKIISQAFIDADKQLENVEFNTSESGTTCCLIIHIGKHIMCANTGDSRAIVTFDESKNKNSEILKYLQCLPLSIDYKPELPEEANRIIKSGGVIEQMTDEFGRRVGPLRVWAKDGDYPGLAMSRSIGDLKGKTLGIIPDPGIFEYNLNETTKFILVCSDGVWEYLNNEKVKDLGKKFYLKNNASEYCHTLISQAFKEWEKKDHFVDDITAVVVYF